MNRVAYCGWLKRAGTFSIVGFQTERSVHAQSAYCRIIEDGNKIKLQCAGTNEPERRYHGVWLRHNCRCPQCLSSSTNQNIVPYENLMDLKVTRVCTEGDQVNVEWMSRTGPHSCSFDVNWLIKHDYTTPGIHEDRKEKEKPLVADKIPVSYYNEAIASKEGYYKWMKQINLYGLTLMKNIPVVDQVLVKFAEQIGEPQSHPFHTVFEVRSVPNPSNEAYSDKALMLHTDQNFLENSLGIQFFHCLRYDDCVQGGESTLVDIYPVIEEFRRKHPKHFEVLSRVPYIAINEHHSLDALDKSISYQFSSPHIRLDSYGNFIGFSWALQVHAPMSVSENDTEDYYKAMVVLTSMIENSPRKFVQRLRPGEAIITNNRRMLHGRNSFACNGGERHLQGFYLSIDDFRSRLVVLSRELNKTEPLKNFLNMSSVA